MKTTTQKVVISAMLAALVCVATMIIKIPSPLKGYINLGDPVVLLCGWLLPPGYAFFAAGIGSALADVFSGYVTYAPATFIIKGLVAVIAFGIYYLLAKRTNHIVARIIGGTTAEIFMILGYFLFEGVLYGFVPSVVNIPANAVQGIAGVIFGIILINIFNKNKIIKQ
ncbi:MAG: ECF transporter S component [Clostridia bacterium]|nr:ECF transporter S component [Clostridia bacterium]